MTEWISLIMTLKTTIYTGEYRFSISSQMGRNDFPQDIGTDIIQVALILIFHFPPHLSYESSFLLGPNGEDAPMAVRTISK